MVYTNTSAYSSFQDTITSFCKSILPFRNRRLPATNHKLAKRHADNLKWQQDSFHRILNLIGLRNEGIVPEAEVSAFRIHLLDTLIASPANPDTPTLLRDKLLFLQELLYAKCISSEEYHSSKRPLLQCLAAQGVEIDCWDVIVGAQPKQKRAEEEWSVINLNDEVPPTTLEKDKEKRPLNLLWRGKARNDGSNSKKDKEGNRESGSSMLMPPSSPLVAAVKSERANKRKPFRALFQKEQLDKEDGNKVSIHYNSKERVVKSSNKQWGFEGFKKWKRGEDESNLHPGGRSDDTPANILSHDSSTDLKAREIKGLKFEGWSFQFFELVPSLVQVLGENIKKELSQIQLELSAKNQNMNFSGDQMEAISKKLPVDKADLKKFFPKSWCNRYGDNVLDVVNKEFQGRVGEIENRRWNASEVKQDGFDGKCVGFEDENENLHCSTISEVWNQHLHAEAGSHSYVNKSFSEAQNHWWDPKWDG